MFFPIDKYPPLLFLILKMHLYQALAWQLSSCLSFCLPTTTSSSHGPCSTSSTHSLIHCRGKAVITSGTLSSAGMALSSLMQLPMTCQMPIRRVLHKNFTSESCRHLLKLRLILTQICFLYYSRHLLQMTTGIEDFGGMRWELVAALAVAWILVYFCLWKGIKSSGKVVS